MQVVCFCWFYASASLKEEGGMGKGRMLASRAALRSIVTAAQEHGSARFRFSCVFVFGFQ